MNLTFTPSRQSETEQWTVTGHGATEPTKSSPSAEPKLESLDHCDDPLLFASRWNQSQPLTIYHLTIFTSLAFSLMLMTGCSSKPAPTYPSTNISGTVSLGGQPLQQGNLQFVPVGHQRGTIISAKVIDGKYSAKKVPLGSVRVLIYAMKPTGKILEEYDRKIPEVVNLIADQYRQGIEISIDQQLCQRDFELVQSQTKVTH